MFYDYDKKETTEYHENAEWPCRVFQTCTTSGLLPVLRQVRILCEAEG